MGVASLAAFELTTRSEELYPGLRMTADGFLALPEDRRHYELVDGVVVMSPSPSFWHQEIIAEILFQIRAFLEDRPLGTVVTDIDVKLTDDLVYRPDIVFLNAAKAARVDVRVTEAPDLIVEVISPDSRGYDSRTKREDYERAGVGEYWLIDPEKEAFTFLLHRGGSFHEVAPAAQRHAASVLPGFELDLERVRRLF